MENRDTLLQLLEAQKNYLEILEPSLDSDVPSSSSSSESSDNHEVDGGNRNNGANNNVNENATVSNQSSSFPQDSREVSDENPSCWEPFDE